MRYLGAFVRISLAAGSIGALAACSQPTSDIDARQVGNPDHGRALIQYYGCGACHTIPGVPGADALVGPPLNHFARRVYVAGVLRNAPDDLVLWIRNPQKVVPGNAMPVMGIDEHDARDIAAYLYTIE